jgi:hypothetical protein
MPADPKDDVDDAPDGSSSGRRRRRDARRAGHWASVPGPAPARLRLPVAGMEAEFNVFLDGVEIDPRAFWGHPTAFIEGALLPRERSSFQLPTGGAVYFDRGVLEVVTPVIELAPGCPARMVRNLWEQIAFVRRELSKWEKRAGRHVRLKAYSAHYNVSFDVPRAEQRRGRTVRRLAHLLAHILPVPVALAGTNRRSTGVGVRPRGDRIEVTVDFTPDPGLMIATATAVIGIVRDVMSWPSYDLSLLDRLSIPTIDGVIPGKHTTRKGWLTKDVHYPQSPFTSDVDAPIWKVRGRRPLLSLRAIALRTAWLFRRSIRRHADALSVRLLFSILRGRAPSLLELDDRPSAYDDVGRLCRWGMVLPGLKGFEARRPPPAARPVDSNGATERRRQYDPIPFPDRRLTRSAYEGVFLRLVSGERLRVGRQTYTPVAMKGWYQAVFRRDSDGRERLLTIDQLLEKTKDWQA